MTIRNSKRHSGLTLVELIAVIAIASAILVAVLSVYSRAQATASSINARLDRQMLPNEIIQRIAEDVDRLTLPGLDTTITIGNKVDGGFNVSRLAIATKFYGKGEPAKAHVFEEVIWQSEYDPITDSIILYRLHGGVNLEDKIVEKPLLEKTQAERELFIPITDGITFFEVVAARGDNEYRTWGQSTLPRAVKVRVSFDEPKENMDGEIVVLEEDKVARTIAIDRTRKIRYKFVRQEFIPEDPNDMSDAVDEESDSETDDEGAEEGTDDTVRDEGRGEGPLIGTEGRGYEETSGGLKPSIRGE